MTMPEPARPCLMMSMWVMRVTLADGVVAREALWWDGRIEHVPVNASGAC